MKTASLLLPTALLVAALGLAACDKRAPLDAPKVPTPTPGMSSSTTPNAAMSPASSASAP